MAVYTDVVAEELSATHKVVARVSNRQSLARLVKRAGAIQGPVRIR